MRNRAALLCSFWRRVSALASQTTPTATPAPLQEYRRRGLNPDDFLLTVEALRSIPVQQLAYLCSSWPTCCALCWGMPPPATAA